MTLAEILEEGERLCREIREANSPYKTRLVMWSEADAAFALRHLPTLLAVCRAAVEMRAAQAFYFGRHSIESDADHGSTRLADATAAFDAAVRGDAATGEGRNG